MSTFQRGQFVEHDGLLAVVIGAPEDGGAPDDHVALWYGEPRCKRISQGGTGGQPPEVWTVPAEYCTLAAPPVVRHGSMTPNWPNQITSLDAAIALLFHAGRQGRGASEFFRWAARPSLVLCSRLF